MAIFSFLIVHFHTYLFSCDSLSSLRDSLVRDIQKKIPFPDEGLLGHFAQVRNRRKLQECKRLEQHSWKTLYEKQKKAAKNRYAALLAHSLKRIDNPAIHRLSYEINGLTFATLMKHEDQLFDPNYEEKKFSTSDRSPKRPIIAYEIVSFSHMPFHQFCMENSRNKLRKEFPSIEDMIISAKSSDMAISEITPEWSSFL